MPTRRTFGLIAVATTAVAALSATGLVTANAATALNPSVAPGGNFNLSIWQLQLPTGSPGSPTTIQSSQLKGANGYTNPTYFFTDKNDGAMTFFAPEKGVTTPNSNFARTELRENGDWALSGSNSLNARLRIVFVTKNVCVGQVHVGSGGSSTKPLLELYYRPNGDVILGTQQDPDRSGQDLHTLGNVPVGTQWTYTINVTSSKINMTVNGKKTSYTIPAKFKKYRQYFKAGSYNQSSSNSSTNGAKVKFYELTVSH
jgi:hypothetical protein